jgi:YD repeat-containing protein
MLEHYSFVAITTRDLERARAFWIGQLGFRILKEMPGKFFMIDAGGLRLCVDVEHGDEHVAAGSDPAIGFRVPSVDQAAAFLRERGLPIARHSADGDEHGRWIEIRDPDGRAVILAEAD